MNKAEKIIDALGGIRATAKVLGCPHPTVQMWGKSGFIPVRRHQEVWDAAKRAGIALDKNDFVFIEAPE